MMELGEPDESGRRRPVPVEGKFETLPVTCVISAIGQKANVAGFEGIELNRKGIISADETSYGPLCQGFSPWEMPQTKGRPLPLRPLARPAAALRWWSLYLNGVQVPYQKTYLSVKKVSPEYFADYIKLPRAKMPTVPRRSGSTTFRRSIWASPRPRPGRKRPAVWTAAAMILPNVS